jgi:hypothetical protein
VIVLAAAFGAFLLLAPHVHTAAYQLFVPAGTGLIFPYERDTLSSIFAAVLLTAAQILFLSFVTLWIRRWPGWQEYAFRWVLFVGTLMGSVMVFVSMGFAYRHFSGNKASTVYARDLPVASCLFAVFLATVATTFSIRFFQAKKRTQNP